jgi:hypothetical protein
LQLAAGLKKYAKISFFLQAYINQEIPETNPNTKEQKFKDAGASAQRHDVQTVTKN